MATTTTYSFTDLSGAIAHPALGAYTFTGEGAGEISVSMTTERTAHDVAADGSVMVTKIAGNNGSISIAVQQTSPIHQWLLNWYNYLVAADTSQWAQSALTLRNTVTGDSHVCTGVSPQKVPDKSYQAQGQRVTWVLMCADIQNLTV